MITKETAVVWRGGRRRYLTKKSAIHAEAVSLIKEKYPNEQPEYEQGHMTFPGWHWSEMPRSEVLLRRVMRLVERTIQ